MMPICYYYDLFIFIYHEIKSYGEIHISLPSGKALLWFGSLWFLMGGIYCLFQGCSILSF